MNLRKLSVLLASVFSLLPVCHGGDAFQVRAHTVTDSVLHIAAGTLKIRPYEFADRQDFREIVFDAPVKVREIGGYAFLGCIKLRTVSLPGSVTALGEGAFRECEGLVEADLGKVAMLPKYLFAWCVNLRRVELPSRLADIGSHSFVYCGQLSEVRIPSHVKHIGSNAFSFCKSLRAVALPRSVTELESYAFSECTSLESAVLPGNSHLLGELIFSGCRALKWIEISSPVPPKFDCDSQLFEQEEAYMYADCHLRVPAASVAAYRRAPGWHLFTRVLPIESTP